MDVYVLAVDEKALAQTIIFFVKTTHREDAEGTTLNRLFLLRRVCVCVCVCVRA